MNYAEAVGSSGSASVESAETVTVRALESKLQNQQSLIERLLQRCKDYEHGSKQPSTTLTTEAVHPAIEARVQKHLLAFEDVFTKNILTMIENITKPIVEKIATLTTQVASLANQVTTLTSQVTGLTAQVNNFIAHAKNNYVTKSYLDSLLNATEQGRKKARTNSHNASRSISPNRDSPCETEEPNDGDT